MKKIMLILLIVIFVFSCTYARPKNKLDRALKTTTYLVVFSDAVFVASLITNNFVLMTLSGTGLLVATAIKTKLHTSNTTVIARKCINRSERKMKRKCK